MKVDVILPYRALCRELFNESISEGKLFLIKEAHQQLTTHINSFMGQPLMKVTQHLANINDTDKTILNDVAIDIYRLILQDIDGIVFDNPERGSEIKNAKSRIRIIKSTSTDVIEAKITIKE